MSVSEQQYGDGSHEQFKGFTRMTEQEREEFASPLTGLNGTYADDPEYQQFIRDGTMVGLGSNGRFVAIQDPVRVVAEEPAFVNGQDVATHSFFAFKLVVVPILAVGQSTVGAVQTTFVSEYSRGLDFGNDPGRQRQHCYVNCVVTAMQGGDPSTIAVFGTTQELFTTWRFAGSTEADALWKDSKRDMDANRIGQRNFLNGYFGRCREACISQVP